MASPTELRDYERLVQRLFSKGLAPLVEAMDWADAIPDSKLGPERDDKIEHIGRLMLELFEETAPD